LAVAGSTNVERRASGLSQVAAQTACQRAPRRFTTGRAVEPQQRRASPHPAPELGYLARVDPTRPPVYVRPTGRLSFEPSALSKATGLKNGPGKRGLFSARRPAHRAPLRLPLAVRRCWRGAAGPALSEVRDPWVGGPWQAPAAHAASHYTYKHAHRPPFPHLLFIWCHFTWNRDMAFPGPSNARHLIRYKTHAPRLLLGECGAGRNTLEDGHVPRRKLAAA